MAPNLFHHSPRVPWGLRNDDEKFEEGIEFEQFWEIGMVTFFSFFFYKDMSVCGGGADTTRGWRQRRRKKKCIFGSGKLVESEELKIASEQMGDKGRAQHIYKQTSL